MPIVAPFVLKRRVEIDESNRSRLRTRRELMPFVDPITRRAYARAYYAIHKRGSYTDTNKTDRDRVYNNIRNKLARQKIFFVLGDKCKRCGFTDLRALQIDHVNGNGFAHRKGSESTARGLWKAVKRDFFAFQILCANCNWIKRVELKEYRKRAS